MEQCQWDWEEVPTTIGDLATAMDLPFRQITQTLTFSGIVLEGTPGTPELRNLVEFPDLRCLRIWDAEIDLGAELRGEDHFWVVDIPSMPRLISFALTIGEIHGGDSSGTILFRFGNSPNLRDIDIQFEDGSGMRGAVVRPGHPSEWFSADKKLAPSPWSGWFSWMLAGIDYNNHERQRRNEKFNDLDENSILNEVEVDDFTHEF
jgi:hypothetical protein